MSTQTVLASFYSNEEATEAANQCRILGCEVAQVDELRAYTGVIPTKRTYPISGNIQSLSSLTLDVVAASRDASVLLAADPAASGLSDGQDNVTGRNYLLTVICEPGSVDSVVQIIRSHHGYT